MNLNGIIMLLLIEQCGMFYVQCKEITVVELHEDRIPSTESYVDAGAGKIPTLHELTICMRFRFQQYSEKSALVSYFAGSDNEILLVIDGPESQVFIECCQYSVKLAQDIPSIILFTWYHFCIALDLNGKTVTATLNDNIWSLNLTFKDGDSKFVRPGGHLVIGQDLDTENGGFSLSQTFNGDIANFILFNVSISKDKMVSYAQSCKTEFESPKPIIEFAESMDGFTVKGLAKVYQYNTDHICSNYSTEHIVLIPKKMVFDEASNLCSSLKGTAIVPVNAEEAKERYLLALQFSDQCLSSWSTIYWLGIQGNLSDGQWYTKAGKKLITWSDFGKGWDLPATDCLCASVGTDTYSGKWFCGPCSYKTCPMCSFPKPPQLRLRGLCSDTNFDTNFTITNRGLSKPELVGYFKSRILWSNDDWILEQTKNTTSGYATAILKKQEYPLGRHKWEIKDACGNDAVILTLSACVDGEFTCDDGACIPKEQRCDQKTQCRDNSDESDCVLIVYPASYSRGLPPPITENKLSQVNFSLEITSVRNFNLVGFRVTLDIIQKLKWRDPRIRFLNLRQGNFSNKSKNYSSLWIPTFEIQSGNLSPVDLVPRVEYLLVQRDQPPLPDSITNHREDDVYDGASNPMMLVETYTAPIACQFQLYYYPFDNQKCALLYSLTDTANELQKYVETVKFTGVRTLLEYLVVGVSVNTTVIAGEDFIKVEIEFRNQFGYYIGNAFIPSILLVTICYLTFYFDLQDFQDRIMVSLTSLLVLTGLLTQTSQSIPKTAYLKLIDVWYVAHIVFDFLIIVVLVVIECLRLQDGAEGTSKGASGNLVKPYPRGARKTKKECFLAPEQLATTNKSKMRRRAIRLNTLSLVAFPITEGIFCVYFFVVASHNLYK